MSSTTTIYLVAAICGVLGFTVWIGLILIPALAAYQTASQRIAAGFLSLYVLAAMMGVGLAAGGGVIWIWQHYLA